MDKTLLLRLNKYDPIPSSLQEAHDPDLPRRELLVDLAKLYHHYYFDTYGKQPPSPDPAQFEHVRFLTPEKPFRLIGRGLGASTSARRNRSTELGQAFCRWFLHDHLGITYFAHLSEILDREATRAIANCSVQRVASGDAPDYLCAASAQSIFLAEAKGRYSAVSFGNKDFSEWRAQFARVRVLDATGKARPVKGHIVATRFATEEDSSRIQSTLFAEDPLTPGDGSLGDESARSLASAVIGIHYSRLAEKLNQPLLAAALFRGISLPEEIRIPVVSWRLQIDNVKQRLFMGGYYPGPGGRSAFEIHDGAIRMLVDPLRLDHANGTFLGVEAAVFRSVVDSCRATGAIGPRVQQLESTERIYSAISMLRDGSVVGPIEFFEPVGGEQL